MLRAIKLKCTQQLPNYRKPASMIIKETLPLPPYSTVIGMIHTACGFSVYHPMKISVQGRGKCTVSDIYTKYTFGGGYDPKRIYAFIVESGGKKEGIGRGIGYAELIADVELLLHIIPEEEDFESIFDGLRYPNVYPSLGRYEDTLRFDEISAVDLIQCNQAELKYDAYVPLKYFDIKQAGRYVDGTIYTINKVFDKDNKSKTRQWKEKVEVKHLSGMKNGEIYRFNNAYYDRIENCPVFPA
jgi:CRISPR-associated protein Cas5t